jgi:uncharacterized protein YcnI
MRRDSRFVFAALVGAASLALPAAATAHVSLQPDSLPAGEDTRVDVRVPNERDDAATTKIEVRFPAGLLEASYDPVPGWSARVITERLSTPVRSPEGDQITEQVKQVNFQARTAGAAIRPGQFRDFGILLLPPKRPGASLTFKALQIYNDGKVVRWIGPPGSEDPAPQIKLTAAEQAATPPAGTTPEKEDDGASKTLGVVALVVGGLGLAIGAVALASARGRRT